MNHRKHRLLPVLAALLLLLSALPITAFAASGSTDITATVKHERTMTILPHPHGELLYVAPLKLYEGDTVEFTPVPDEGYALKSIVWYTTDAANATDITAAKKFTMPDADVTVKVEFAEIVAATVGGKVTKGGNPVPDAAVKLYLGTVEIAATVTDKDGNYSFYNVEKGTYNIVVTKGDKVKTVLVTVDSTGSFSVNVALPVSAVNSVVEVSESAASVEAKTEVSQIVVGGLDAIAEAQTLDPGDKVTIKLTVEPKADANTQEQQAIKTKAGNGKKVEFLDLSLWKQVNNDAAQPIGDTNTQLLTIVIPFDFTGVDVSSVMILRHHGSTEKLTRNPAPGQEGYVVNAQAGTITLYAMKFSDYALAYEEQTYYPGGNGGTTTYSITGANTENGKLTVSRKNASAGQTVTITVSPDEGYKLNTLTVKDAKGNVLTLTKVNDTTYTFKMPSGKVSISATFTESVDSTVCPQDETCVYARFTDADTKAWYHDGVHFCVEKGYMQGVSDTKFAPSGTLSRAMIVTMLWRMEGEPVVNYAMTFKDVPAEQWYTEAIRWAQSTGVVEGYSAESFGPNDDVTREQLAAILYRYAAFMGIDVTARADLAKFTDASAISAWALENVQWANAVGLINGRTTTTIVPTSTATRAEAANMVQRFCETVLEK